MFMSLKIVFIFKGSRDTDRMFTLSRCVKVAKFHTCPGHVNGPYLLGQRKYFIFLKKQTMHIPYFADTIYKLFKNSMNPDINSFENSVDTDQMA